VSGWLSPDFRGNISASIDQLGDFAALFGANAAIAAKSRLMERWIPDRKLADVSWSRAHRSHF
jgi:hypothetical protein